MIQWCRFIGVFFIALWAVRSSFDDPICARKEGWVIEEEQAEEEADQKANEKAEEKAKEEADKKSKQEADNKDNNKAKEEDADKPNKQERVEEGSAAGEQDKEQVMNNDNKKHKKHKKHSSSSSHHTWHHTDKSGC